MKDEHKAEVLNAFLASVFISKANSSQGTQSTELEDGNREGDDAPMIQWENVSELLHHLNVHKSMRLDGIHPRVL